MHRKVQNLSKEVKDVKRVTMVNTIMMAFFVVWSLVKPDGQADSSPVIATGGSVAANLSISGNNEEMLEKARRRGYFTASEYAKYDNTSLETVYRHANNGDIDGAVLIDGRWHIPVPQSGN